MIRRGSCVVWVTVLVAWANITTAQDANANTSLIKPSGPSHFLPDLDLATIHNLTSLDLEALGNSTGIDFLPSNDYPSLIGGGPEEYLNDYNNDYYYDEGPAPPLDINATVGSSWLHKCHCEAHQVYLSNGTCADQKTEVQILHPYTLSPMFFNTSHFKMVVATELQCKNDTFVSHPKYFIITATGKLFLYSHNLEFPYEDYCIEHIIEEAGNINWEASVCLPKPLIATCCGEGEVLAPGNSTCIPYKGKVPFAPPVNIDEGHLGPRQLDKSTLFENDCSEDSVKEVELNGETAVLHYALGRPPHLAFHNEYMLAENPQAYCLAARETEDGSLKYVARFCYHDKCINSTCVRKCCDPYMHLENGTCSAIKDEEAVLKYTFHQRDSLSIVNQTLANITEYFGMLVHCIPEKGLGVIWLTPKTNPKDTFYLLSDGSLYLPQFRKGGVCGNDKDSYYSIDSFCVDTYLDEDNEYSQLVMVCHKELEIKGCQAGTVLYPILMGISCIFLVLTLIVYLGVTSLRERTYGRCLISLVISILVVYITFICNYAGILESNASCYSAAFIGHFSSLSMFFWLSVMGYDMWFTLRSSKPQSQSKKLFTRYSLYAWGFPLFFALIALIIRLLPETEDYCHIIRPDYVNHGRGCSFNSLATRWVYQYWVILALTCLNMFFFVHVTITLIRNHKQTKQILKSPNSRQSNAEKQKKTSRMWLYIKLFLVMGITWIIEVISFKDCGWIVGDIFNLLQGVFIFVITVCREDVFKKVQDAWKLRKLGDGIGTIRDRMSRSVGGSTTSPERSGGSLLGCCGQKWTMVDTEDDSNKKNWTPLESINLNDTQM